MVVIMKLFNSSDTYGWTGQDQQLFRKIEK